MRPDISLARQEAERCLDSGQPLVVRGPVGSGLRTLAEELQRRRASAVLIELLDLEHPDAPAAGLLQVIAHIGDPLARERLVESLPDIETTARQAAAALVGAGKSLVVLVPPTWDRSNEDLEEDDTLRPARALMRGLTSATPYVLIADQQVDLSALGIPAAREVRLPPHAVRLDDGWEAWGPYAAHARRLGESLASSPLSPLVWRLAVGGVALGASLAAVRESCRRPAAEAFRLLIDAVADRLRERPLLFQAVRRALQVRRPESPELLATTTRIPEDHLPLLTDCLGYGDPVRFPPALRAELVRALGGPSLPDVHVALAAHYRALDGIQSPRTVQSPAQVVAWVERAHHLAFAGEQGTAAWSELDLPAPEFYRDRARALSTQKKYAEAAQVYLECVRRFPGDDYSHHYAAWNLNRAGGDRELARKEYEAAIALAESNPWWNARYVTFLISAGEWGRAHGAWRRALQSIDPDGTATARTPWLATHLHYWVAQEWCRAGVWWQARRVVESVPEHIRTNSKRNFSKLGEEIAAVEQRERQRFAGWLAAQGSAPWETVQALWASIEHDLPGLPLPVAGPGEEGRVQLAWSLPDHYLEIEVGAEAHLVWYARDLGAGTSESGEGGIPIPLPLRESLERLSHA